MKLGFKFILFFVLLASSSFSVFALTSGPNNAGIGTDVTGIGSTIWSNSGNVISNDNAYATANVGSSSSTHYLQGTNFGFNIPTGSTINGIQVTIGRYTQDGSLGKNRDNVVRLIKGGTIIGNNKAIAADWSTSEGVATYGGISDLWGTTWTPEDIIASNFGVVLSVQNTNWLVSRTAYVDFVQVTVTYTLPSNSCTCPALNSNWMINMSNNCILNSNCNIGTGNVSFIGTGSFTINSTLSSLNFAAPTPNSVIWITSRGLWI